MSKVLKVTFTHPFYNRTLEMDIPGDTRFLEVTKLLYKNGFIKKKKGDYQYIIDGHLCSLGEKLESYAYTGDELKVKIHGLLTILA